MTVRNSSPRVALARAVGRMAGIASRVAGRGGGTTLPGVVARWIDPDVANVLASRLDKGVVLVTGTNGKTTTSRLISSMVAAAGWPVVHNRAGANLMTGITSALLSQRGSIGLFEVDEAHLPSAIRELRPRLIVCLNLFRDQLDRYGELNRLATVWRDALSTLPAPSCVLLNADDPLVATLGEGLEARVTYFGLNDSSQALDGVDHAADSLYCPHCGHRLQFSAIYFGHLGIYACSACAFSRPVPQFEASHIHLAADGPSELSLVPVGHLAVRLPGLYNVYNVLAASAAATILGVAGAEVKSAVEMFDGAFGRTEKVHLEDRELRLFLAKNPVGYNEVIRTLLLDSRPLNLYLSLNDRIADGEDVSWIWDVDFERLRGRVAGLILGGTRAEDLAVRVKYADLDASLVSIERDHWRAIQQLARLTPEDAPGYVVPTYTAMLDLRSALAAAGAVRQFWED